MPDLVKFKDHGDGTYRCAQGSGYDGLYILQSDYLKDLAAVEVQLAKHMEAARKFKKFWPEDAGAILESVGI